MAALCGCAHAPQSYTFAASGPRDGAINAVAVTLKKQGIEPGVIDYRAGTITSRWFDTGYRFREIDDNRPLNYYTDIFLRHHILVSESSGTLNVAVKTDIQRCAPLDAVITAFQRHFRPSCIDGVADSECAAILESLLAT